MFESYPSPFAPLEGTVPAPRALFIDRWGTLLQVPPHGFARSPEEVEFFPGVMEALFRASRARWKLYLLGNEDAVINGDQTEDAWKIVQDAVLGQLMRAGVPIQNDYACTQGPEGPNSQRLDSVYLLPNTGAFYHAHHTDGIHLEKSWVIGDSTLELVAGWRAGCRQAGVQTGLSLADGTFAVDPEFKGADLAATIDELLARQSALHP